MMNIFSRAGFLTLLLFLLPANIFASPAGLIISIDGLKGSWIANPDANGLKIPHIRKLMNRGTRVDAVRGVLPTITYPSHTTLITGVRPVVHGILSNNIPEQPTSPQTKSAYWNYKFIKVPTLLDAARDAKLKTASVSWPVTVDAPVDMLYPEIWDPKDLEERIVKVSQSTKPQDLIVRVLSKYGLEKGESDANRASIASYIVDTLLPDLMLVHFIELDEAEHVWGPNSRQAKKTFEHIDGLIGKLVERYQAAGRLDDTLIAIVSDHGFWPIQKSFNVNALFREHGLIQMKDDNSGLAQDYEAFAWGSAGACAITLRDPKDEGVLRRVRDVLSPFVGKAGSPIHRIVEEKEIASLGGFPGSSLVLDFAPGYRCGTALNGNLISNTTDKNKMSRGAHGYMPDRPEMESTFIVAGPGIAKRRRINRMEMVDIAPTLASALGLSLPSAEGKVQDIFSQTRLRSN